MEIINKIVAVIKSDDLRSYRDKTVVDFGELVLTKDIGSGIGIAKDTKEFLFSIPNIIFFDKLKNFLCGTYRDFSEQVKLARKFNEDNDKYLQFTKRQILLLNEIDEDVKIFNYASLTRACLLELIDSPLYFKLANILKHCTSEELFYLRDHIDRPIDGLNIFIDSFTDYGIVKKQLATSSGKNEYKYTELARHFVNFAMNLENDKYVSSPNTIKLETISVLETKISNPFIPSEYNGVRGVSITPRSINEYK